MCQKYPNVVARERLGDLIVIRREVKKVNQQDKQCIIFRHNDFDNQEIYCAERYARVLTERNEVDFFTGVPVGVEVTEEVKEGEEEEIAVPWLANTDLAENIARLRAEGYGVDDDNEPAPENVPTVEPAQVIKPIDASIYNEWDSCTICHRYTQGMRYERAQLVNQLDPTSSYLDHFNYYLPIDYIKDILIVQTNKEGG